MPNIGPLEIAIVLIIVLIIFGPKRLPELGKSMGRGIREFKGSLTGDDKDSSEEARPELRASHSTAAEKPTQPATGETAAKPAEPVETAAKPAEPVEGEVVTENKG
jgi:sec-independent protein translocase protein TatA